MSASLDTAQTSARDVGLDVLRGALLIAMLAVHVVAAHSSPAQSRAFHEALGIFIISSGFVALSGYSAGLTDRSLWVRIKGAARLLIVMVGWGVLLSLLRHALIARPAGCPAGAWLPPTRFETLGILLAIAPVQVLAAAARQRSRLRDGLCLALAVALTLLPGLSAVLPEQGAVRTGFDALARRSLTPFYTLSTFIALGVVGAWLGARWSTGGSRSALSPSGRAVTALAAIGLSLPAVSGAVLDRAYGASGEVGGGLSTLAYWAVVVALLLTAARGAHQLHVTSRPLALLGRHSLLVFVVHLLLLEFDAAAQSRFGLERGLGTVSAMFALNLLVLLALCAWAERRPGAAAAMRTLFLFGSQDKGWFARLSLGVTMAAVVAAYSGPAFARPRRELLVEDFESGASCKAHWRTGASERRGSTGCLVTRPKAPHGRWLSAGPR